MMSRGNYLKLSANIRVSLRVWKSAVMTHFSLWCYALNYSFGTPRRYESWTLHHGLRCILSQSNAGSEAVNFLSTLSPDSRRLSEKIGTRSDVWTRLLPLQNTLIRWSAFTSPLSGKPFCGYPLTFTPLTPAPDILAIFMQTSQRRYASLERL